MAELTLLTISIILALAIIVQSELHRRQMNDILNRFMARNLTEYQTGKGKIDVKRSDSGNFIYDRLQEIHKSNTLDD